MTSPDDDTVAPDVTPLKPGEPFRLKFGLFVFATMEKEAPSMDVVWERFSRNDRGMETEK